MPRGHSSNLIASLSPSSANLLAAYPPLNGVASLPSTELTLMIVPPPAAVIEGSTAFIMRNAPKKLVSSWDCSSSSEKLLHRSPESVAGVVDQHIDASIRFDHGRRCFGDGPVGVDVELDAVDAPDALGLTPEPG